MQKLITVLISALALVLAVCSMLLTACGSSDVEEVLNSIKESKLQSFSGKLDFEYDSLVFDGYTWTAQSDGSNPSEREKIHNELKYEQYSEFPDLDLTIKGNYPEGNFDLFAKNNRTYLDADGETVIEEKNCFYWFFRGWEGYEINSKEEIDDLNGKEPYYMGNNQIFKIVSTDTVEYAPRIVNYFIINLADRFGGLSVNGDKLSVDLNVTVYNLLNSLKDVINNLKPSTTLGDLLADDTLKTVISSLVNGLTPEEAADYISKNFLEPMKNTNELVKEFYELLGEIKPDANSSTFDYIVKFFTDDRTYDILNEYFKEHNDVALPAKLDKITLDFVLDTFDVYNRLDNILGDWYGYTTVYQPGGWVTSTKNEDWEEIKDFNSCKKGVLYAIEKLFGETTQTKACFHIPTGWHNLGYVVTDAKVEYSVSNGKIASQNVSAVFMITEHYNESYSEDENTYRFADYDQIEKYKIKGEMTYGTSKHDLTDIIIEK